MVLTETEEKHIKLTHFMFSKIHLVFYFFDTCHPYNHVLREVCVHRPQKQSMTAPCCPPA